MIKNTATAKKLSAVRPIPRAHKNERSYWSGQEAEEIIKRIAAGEKITEEAERLDVMIDPETAMIWLRRNKHNRKLANYVVERYATDMLAGNWPYTHQGIAFDRYGELLDGQHRMQAIVASGCTIPMQVTVNMPPEIKRAIDQGKSRTVADVTTLECKTQVEEKMAACAMKMIMSVNKMKVTSTRTDKVDFIIRHLQAIVYSMEMIPQKYRVAYAAVRAVIARAYYTADKQRIERFCSVLCDGGYAPGEELVWRLREFIQQRGCRSAQDAREIYLKTEWALWKFLNNETGERLHSTEKELFPLPAAGDTVRGN
jgi:hypothetical protein